MKKFLTFATILVLLMGLGILYYVLFEHKPAPDGQSGTTPGGSTFTPGTTGYIPGTGTTGTPSGIPEGKMRILGVGGDIIVNDFTVGRKAFDTGMGLGGKYYNLEPEATSTPYQIQYWGPDTSFQIVLRGNPLGLVRREMEQYLLTLLGIGTEVACTLKYSVRVQTSYSELYSGQDLRFSFCPGAATLPEI